MAKNFLILLMGLVVLAASATAGCTSNVTPSSNNTTKTSSALLLEGTTWKLTSLASEAGLNTTLPNTTITANFSDGNITGSSGCNRYFGSYQLNKTDIEIGQVGSTMMFCADPDGVMAQETSYLLLLQNVTSYAISNNKLTLSNSTGNPQLVFEAALNVTTAAVTA